MGKESILLLEFEAPIVSTEHREKVSGVCALSLIGFIGNVDQKSVHQGIEFLDDFVDLRALRPISGIELIINEAQLSFEEFELLDGSVEMSYWFRGVHGAPAGETLHSVAHFFSRVHCVERPTGCVDPQDFE